MRNALLGTRAGETAARIPKKARGATGLFAKKYIKPAPLGLSAPHKTAAAPQRAGCPVVEPDVQIGGTRAPDHGLPSALTTEQLQTQFAVLCFAVLRRVAASLPAPRLYVVRSRVRVSLISIPFIPFHRLHVSKRVLPASPWHSGLLCLSTSDYTQTPRVTTLDRPLYATTTTP